MIVHRRIELLLLCLCLTACGGGGGGNGAGSNGGGSGGTGSAAYSITLSSSALTFSGTQYHPIATSTVTANFKGDGVIVGTLPGNDLPTWLRVVTGTSAGQQASFEIAPYIDGLAAGDYTTTLRFITGKADGSAFVYKDLPISLHLDEGFSVDGTLAFAAVAGSDLITPVGSNTLNVKGAHIAWSAELPTWLQLSPSSGTTRGVVSATASAAGLAVGRYSTFIRFTDNVSTDFRLVPASLEVVAPQPEVSVTGLSFSVDSQTALSATQKTLSVGDTAAGQNVQAGFSWTAKTNSPLVTVSPSSGTTFPSSTTLTASLDLTQLNGTPTGQYAVAVVLEFTTPGSSYPITMYVPVTVDVRLPRAGSANPYALTSGAPHTISIIGEDLREEDIQRIRLDGQPLPAGASSSRLSNKELQITLPALTAGFHPIAFNNALGLARSAASLAVYAPASPGAGQMVETGVRRKLIYDKIRNRLYAVDRAESQLERYRWNGTSWVSVGPVALPSLRDAVMMRDGRRLLVSAAGGTFTIDLSSDTALATPATDPVYAACSNVLANSVAVTEAGTAFASSFGASCTNFYYSSVFEYDLLASAPQTLMRSPYVGSEVLAVSAANMQSTPDGRYVVIASTADSGGYYHLLDMRTRSDIDSGEWGKYGVYYYYALNISDAGTKILINNDLVRDSAGTTLGHLRANQTAQLSADGQRAYTYVDGPGGTGHVEVLDLSQPVGIAGVFPKLSADITVPSDMGVPDTRDDYGNVTSFGMALSADERLLFVSGPSRIVAIALP
jgi:hypothetical protein